MPPTPPGSFLSLLEEAFPDRSGRLRALAARARSGGDAALVHDVRVTLRRLEAFAALFGDVPARGAGTTVRDEARSLRRRLSLLRSEEVGRALLEERGRDGAALAALVFPGALHATRVFAPEMTRVERAVAAWRRRVAASLEGAFAPRAAAEEILRRGASRRLRRRLRALAALLPPDGATLHAARIAAKRVRYALEAIEGSDPRVRPLLRLLRPFQDAAGDAHDLAELAERLRAFARRGGPDASGAAAEARRLEDGAAVAVAAARRLGGELAGPAKRLRRVLRSPGTR